MVECGGLENRCAVRHRGFESLILRLEAGMKVPAFLCKILIMNTSSPNTESHYRSLIKGVSWRIVGTLDTILLSYLVTGKADEALKIGITEVFSKIVLYWLHERVWQNYLKTKNQTRTLTIAKTISWRIVGSIDTMILAWFYTGDWRTGLTIASFETITKIILYYLHERVWLKVPKGSIRESFKKK